MQENGYFEFKKQIERNILTALMMSPKAYDLLRTIWDGEKNTTETLQELFDNTFYADVFMEIWDMYKRGEKVDPVNLKDKLYEEVEMSDIMDILKDSTPHSSDPTIVMLNGYALWGMFWNGAEI